MSQTLETYDPNARLVLQVVEITFMQWGYKATFTTRVGGNCHGFTVMDCAVGNVYDSLQSDDGISPTAIFLTNDAGDTLACEDEEDGQTDWLKDMTVSVRIIAVEADAG